MYHTHMYTPSFNSPHHCVGFMFSWCVLPSALRRCRLASSPPRLVTHNSFTHTHTNLSHNSCTYNSVTQSSFMQSVFHHLLYLSLSCLSHPISTCCAYWKKSTCRVLRSFNLKDSGKSPSNYVDHGPPTSQPAGFQVPGVRRVRRTISNDGIFANKNHSAIGLTPFV